MPDQRIFLQTARDIKYDAEKPGDYAAKRVELDNKRTESVRRYLKATMTGRELTFDIQVHDPAKPGIDGAAPRVVIPPPQTRVGGGTGGVAAGGGAPRRNTQAVHRAPRDRHRDLREVTAPAAVPVDHDHKGFRDVAAYLMDIMNSKLHRTGWRPAVLAAAGCLLLVPSPAFAGGYWRGFQKYWSSYIGNTSGIVMTALVVGAISLFIITRGKWSKS